MYHKSQWEDTEKYGLRIIGELFHKSTTNCSVCGYCQICTWVMNGIQALAQKHTRQVNLIGTTDQAMSHLKGLKS